MTVFRNTCPKLLFYLKDVRQLLSVPVKFQSLKIFLVHAQAKQHLIFSKANKTLHEECEY